MPGKLPRVGAHGRAPLMVHGRIAVPRAFPTGAVFGQIPGEPGHRAFEFLRVPGEIAPPHPGAAEAAARAAGKQILQAPPGSLGQLGQARADMVLPGGEVRFEALPNALPNFRAVVVEELEDVYE